MNGSQLKAMAVAGIALLLPMTAAEAKVRAAGNSTAILLTSTAVFVDAPINGAATTISFNMAQKGRVVITYSAECSVSGNVVNWATLQIVLNGNIIAPTQNDTTICSDNTTAIHDGFVQISKSVVAKAKAGNNVLKIKVRMAFVNAGSELRLEDSSTVVLD